MGWLLNYKDFITRSHCGLWEEWLIEINQMSNMGMFIAYTFISAFLFYFWTKRKSTWFESYIFIGFFSFIFLCGITHLCNVLAFYYPMYRLFTLVDSITAIIGLITTVFLSIIFTRINDVPTLGDYLNIKNDLTYNYKKLEYDKNELENQVNKLSREKELIKMVVDVIDIPQNIKDEILTIIDGKVDTSGKLYESNQ